MFQLIKGVICLTFLVNNCDFAAATELIWVYAFIWQYIQVTGNLLTTRQLLRAKDVILPLLSSRVASFEVEDLNLYIYEYSEPYVLRKKRTSWHHFGALLVFNTYNWTIFLSPKTKT